MSTIWKEISDPPSPGSLLRTGFFALRKVWLLSGVLAWVPAGLASTGPNLLAHGGFESGATREGIPHGWGRNDYVTRATYERVAADAPEGRAYLRMTVTNYVAGSAMLPNCGRGFRAGKLYEFSALLRSDDGGQIVFMMRQNGAPYHDFIRVRLKPDTAWKRYVFRQTLTKDTDVGFRLLMDLVGSVCLDDVRVREVSRDEPLMEEALLADSKYPVVYPRGKPNPGKTYPNAGRNLLPNGSFELGRRHWAFLATDWGPDHIQKGNLLFHDAVTDGSTAAEGARSLHFASPTGTVIPWELSSPYVNLNAGRDHTVSFWAKSSLHDGITFQIGSGE